MPRIFSRPSGSLRESDRHTLQAELAATSGPASRPVRTSMAGTRVIHD